MKKLLIAATVVLVSSSPLVLLPMEKELTLTPKQVQKLTQNTTASLTQFKQIPKNPRTITTILTYKNKDLTEFKTSIQADTKLSISAIFWNAKGEPVFQLQDGDYVAASQKSIVDDSIYNQKPVDMTLWTKDGFTVYKEPYVLGTEKADSKLASFKPIKVSQAAQTHAGTYYLVDGEGWINASDLSTTDNRIEAVQKVLNEKYNNQERISVYVKQLDTDRVAAINDEKSMYAAAFAAAAAQLPVVNPYLIKMFSFYICIQCVFYFRKRNNWRLLFQMFPNHFLHPYHIIPAIEFISTCMKFPNFS